MNKSRKNLRIGLSIFIFMLFISLLQAQTAKKVQFIGSARSVMNNNEINVKDSSPDTVTAKKNTGGYALIDLGVNIMPNKNTEILGMIRIRNAFGGFYGGGVTFDVRQLYVKGIIADVVRYQIGDVNYKLTPYTFYNHDEETFIPEPVVFKMQKEIVNYETFYQKNTWRQQGAALDFGLEFAKYIKEIKFNSFITRINATDFASAPERFFGGGNIGIQQSEKLYVGVNYVNLFDLVGTVPDSNAYRNQVISFNGEYKWENEKFDARIFGETGMSKAFFTLDTVAPKLDDSFLDVGISFKYKPINTRIKIGYMDIGPDFRSAGAQSKRINYNGTNSIYSRYTNQQILRPSGMLFDLIHDESYYNKSINGTGRVSPFWIPNNNVLPYGVATFNRKGIYIKADFADKKEIVNITADAYLLNEIRGQGTKELRSFTLYKSNIEFNLNKLIGVKKTIKLTAGTAMQSTLRGGEKIYEQIDLKSNLFNAGAEIEVFKNIDLMAGIMTFSSEGNELSPTLNLYSEIIDFNEFEIDLKEKWIGGGLRYRFSEKTYLSLLYQSYTFKDNLKTYTAYDINQFLIIYNMKF